MQYWYLLEKIVAVIESNESRLQINYKTLVRHMKDRGYCDGKAVMRIEKEIHDFLHTVSDQDIESVFLERFPEECDGDYLPVPDSMRMDLEVMLLQDVMGQNEQGS